MSDVAGTMVYSQSYRRIMSHQNYRKYLLPSLTKPLKYPEDLYKKHVNNHFYQCDLNVNETLKFWFLRWKMKVICFIENLIYFHLVKFPFAIFLIDSSKMQHHLSLVKINGTGLQFTMTSSNNIILVQRRTMKMTALVERFS